MRSNISIYVDKATVETIDKIANERKWSKSQTIREAIAFFDEFGLDDETIEKIRRLSKKTKLGSKQLLAYAIAILDDIMKRGE